MAAALAAILAALIPVLLKSYWDRKDVTDAVKWQLYQQLDAIRVGAEAWKAEAFSDPSRAATLRVQPDAQGLRPGGPRADPPRGPGGGAV